MSKVQKCQVTFPCLSCGHSITMRTFSVKQINCNKKGCRASYELRANGFRYMHLKMWDPTRDIYEEFVPSQYLDISIDEEEYEDD